MNGRVYDYNLGRFMSVDPFIQMPESSQSINPYSYIMNNPMSGTDPTGYLEQDVDNSAQYTNTDVQKAEDISDKTFEKLEVDSNGNVFITAEGVEYKVKSIVKAGVASGAENGTVKGLNSDSGEVTKNIGMQETSKYRDRSGNPINVNEMSASNGAGVSGAMSDELTQTQELFMEKHSLSKKDFGSIINLVRDIRSVGHVIAGKYQIWDSLEGITNGQQMKLFGSLIGISVNVEVNLGGEYGLNAAKSKIMHILTRKKMDEVLPFVISIGSNATQMIYVSPAFNRFKSGLPKNIQKVLDRYDDFKKLEGALK
ncbi:hypothetical protein NBRC116595_18890 [Aliiglaciecola sp. NS0011-25]